MASPLFRRGVAPLLLVFVFGAPMTGAFAADAVRSPYAGQQTRPIKSLSATEVSVLLARQGAGYAKAAELNGYPGPAHVLELSRPLRLDSSQRAATETLQASHRIRAREFGARVVAAEAELDKLFAGRQATAATVDEATLKVALLQAHLRAEHLKTHLLQAALLTPEQTRRYAVLRGYQAGEAMHPAGDEANEAAGSAHMHH